MIAEIYIVAESFRDNQNLTKTDIEAKTKLFAQDVTLIHKYRTTNKLFFNSGIYPIIFINGLTLEDILTDYNNAKSRLDRDVYNAILAIFAKSELTDNTLDDIKEVLLDNHNENVCYGLIAFKKMPDINEDYQIIYNDRRWFKFRRNYLGMYPKNPKFYIEECKKYFPNLFFHERNVDTISDIIKDCHKRILYHLQALNDVFVSMDKEGKNRTMVLVEFSQKAELDEIASLEGNPERKEAFTFAFKNNQDVDEYICCEPHLKLCYNDNYPGDRAYSNDRRIYFHEGKNNIEDGKVLIGHIGRHL